MRQSPRGESATEPTFGPSGIAERLNCCEKKREKKVYRYDEDTGELTVECLFAGNPVSFTGRAKHADGVLTLLFEANAALGSLRASSQQYAQNPKLQQIAAILERYPGVMLGAELKRR